ncbi:MAG: type II toxin-antitoxin system HicB family antitoxin [Promethearchaeota archaeon]
MLYSAIEKGTSDKWYGRIIDLPGTITKANSREDLLQNLESEVNEHILWLKHYNEEISISTHERIIIKEELFNITRLGESGGTVALFEFDKQAITSERLVYYLKLMEFSRQSLLELIGEIPLEKLSEQLSDSNRTTIQVLTHICNAEEWYKSRLGKEADILYEKYIGMSIPRLDETPILERLELVRRGCINVLKDLIIQKGARIFTREAFTPYPKEQWTSNKILRRFIEHEREHYYSIKTRSRGLADH